ncbi:ATP synthase F1 subunit epsilon [Robiginitomaculum antarcticum]|uniref:ATP synthase F1 subunit epsilon n=1 Tax=Robiginitomaculum antarcticum TaxID=437507 RepID=UPI000374DFF8|nr:ATP synthase F1 subunit epsilon [Robiginitomaculum antarcticum]
MAEKLHFSLVSPARELYSGAVDQVDVPGTEGDFGVLPDHAPLMAAIRTGLLGVYHEGVESFYFVQGGFADVTPAGLTVLAEKAMPLGDVDLPGIEAEIERIEKKMHELEGDAALSAAQDVEGLKTVAAIL